MITKINEVNNLSSHQFDHKAFRQLANEIIETFIQEELEHLHLPIHNMQPKSEASALALVENGVGIEQAVALFKQDIAPNLVRNYGSRFFNWVVGGRTPAAVLGDFYTTMYDQIVMLAQHGVASEIELVTIKWLLQLFLLDENTFQGVFTTGATEANLCALAAARQWYGEKLQIDISQEGLFNLPPMKVITGSAHASIDKAMKILGCGSQHLIKIINAEGKLDLTALEHLLADEPHRIVVANCGEVNTGESDDLAAIAILCQRYQAWLHVDAAFGLFARCSEKHRKLTAGIEHANSICCDGHKLGNVPYGCGFLFINKINYPHLQKTFANTAPYLAANYDHPMNTRVANSQRFLALPLWFSLLAYGKNGYRAMVKRQTEFAEKIAQWLQNQPDVELVRPVAFNIVIFRHRDITTVEENARLIKCINHTNLLSLSGTIFNGQPALRIAVANWHTDLKHDFIPTTTGLSKGFASFREELSH